MEQKFGFFLWKNLNELFSATMQHLLVPLLQPQFRFVDLLINRPTVDHNSGLLRHFNIWNLDLNTIGKGTCIRRILKT